MLKKLFATLLLLAALVVPSVAQAPTGGLQWTYIAGAAPTGDGGDRIVTAYHWNTTNGTLQPTGNSYPTRGWSYGEPQTMAAIQTASNMCVYESGNEIINSSQDLFSPRVYPFVVNMSNGVLTPLGYTVLEQVIADEMPVIVALHGRLYAEVPNYTDPTTSKLFSLAVADNCSLSITGSIPITMHVGGQGLIGAGTVGGQDYLVASDFIANGTLILVKVTNGSMQIVQTIVGRYAGTVFDCRNTGYFYSITYQLINLTVTPFALSNGQLVSGGTYTATTFGGPILPAMLFSRNLFGVTPRPTIYTLMYSSALQEAWATAIDIDGLVPMVSSTDQVQLMNYNSNGGQLTEMPSNQFVSFPSYLGSATQNLFVLNEYNFTEVPGSPFVGGSGGHTLGSVTVPFPACQPNN